MIQEIKIINFQKHKNLKIEFDSNITTIIGKNDSGKSAIIRALQWAILNQSPNSDFITNGEKDCKIELKIDGKNVIRKRLGSTNEYYLDDQKFLAFGTKVPEPIEQFLSIDEVNCGLFQVKTKAAK